jgi:hypothetical protein
MGMQKQKIAFVSYMKLARPSKYRRCIQGVQEISAATQTPVFSSPTQLHHFFGMVHILANGHTAI